MDRSFVEIEIQNGPIVMTAIHHGHDLRPDVASCCALTPDQRLREEDPYTGHWVGFGDARIVVHRSRFEVDLNRTLEHCVYRSLSDAWGLDVWQSPPSARMLADSRAIHVDFYNKIKNILDQIMAQEGIFILLDIHSYNHRRQGPLATCADPTQNPDIDILIPEAERGQWHDAVEIFRNALGQITLQGRPLTIGENTRFQRAAFGNWVGSTYRDRALVLVVEFKKIFMDEWTGVVDEEAMGIIGQGLAAGVNGLRNYLAGNRQKKSPPT